MVHAMSYFKLAGTVTVTPVCLCKWPVFRNHTTFPIKTPVITWNWQLHPSFFLLFVALHYSETDISIHDRTPSSSELHSKSTSQMSSECYCHYWCLKKAKKIKNKKNAKPRTEIGSRKSQYFSNKRKYGNPLLVHLKMCKGRITVQQQHCMHSLANPTNVATVFFSVFYF